jgi:hypothetical protein
MERVAEGNTGTAYEKFYRNFKSAIRRPASQNSYHQISPDRKRLREIALALRENLFSLRSNCACKNYLVV